MRKRENGFTLIEIMVVIAILGVLMASVTIGINMAMNSQAKTRTQNVVNQLGLWLDQVAKPENLGRVPRTDSSRLVGPGSLKTAKKYGEDVGRPNTTNVGIETLYAAVAIPEFGSISQPEIEELHYGNTDDDDMDQTIGSLPDPAFLEFLDAWGNPLVYIASADYKDMKDIEDYVLVDGTIVQVEPLRHETTGKFRREDSFQLFSMGPDGLPGTEDDIHYGLAR